VPIVEIVIGSVILAILVLAIRIVRADPYEQGENAFIDGMLINDNPYSKLTRKSKSKAWNAGFRNTEEASKKGAQSFDSHPWKN